MSEVVQGKDVAGFQAVLVYTVRDPVKGINRTEHVHADLQLGRRFDTTTGSDAKVWLSVINQWSVRIRDASSGAHASTTNSAWVAA